MAGVVCETEVRRFIHEFASYTKVEQKKEAYEAGLVCKEFAEMSDPAAELNEQYVAAVHAACRALFTLDKKFFRAEGLHIVCMLETFEEMKEALEEIDSFFAA